MLRTILVVTALLAGFALEASAQAPQGTQGTRREQDACKPDVTRHCRLFIEQGDFVILRCLQQNRAKLSRACLKVLEEHGQ
jgi:hypothetical protein